MNREQAAARCLDVLAICARVPLDAGDAERIAALAREGLDWDLLLSLAARHAVRPLLHQALRTACPDVVPAQLAADLRTTVFANLRRNALSARRLLEALQALAQAGIPALAYKGPLSAVVGYGDLALREYGDMDLLVRAADVTAACEALASAGWRDEFAEHPRQRLACLRFSTELHLRGPAHAVPIELHWRLYPHTFPLAHGLADAWERRQEVALEGSSVATLGPDDALLVCCLHGSIHAWERLQWVCDVARLAGPEQGVDWTRLQHRARREGVERMVATGLLLAHDALRAELPAEALAWAEGVTAARPLAVAMRAGLRDPGDRRLAGLPRMTSFARTRDRVRCLWRRAVTPTRSDWRLISLPPALFGLYYVLRPVRLALRM